MTDRSKRPTRRGTAGGPTVGGPDDDDPTEVDRKAAAPGDSAPKIRAISMKTPHAEAPPRKVAGVPPVHIQLRNLSEVTPTTPAQNLGRLAPPYDPVAARKRSIREYIVWTCVALILASGIALIVWFAARS